MNRFSVNELVRRIFGKRPTGVVLGPGRGRVTAKEVARRRARNKAARASRKRNRRRT